MAVAVNQSLWPDESDTHERKWIAFISGDGLSVVVRHVAITSPGESLSEYPPTYELTWDEWVTDHESTYGLSLAGAPIAAASERKAAWRKIRRMTNGEMAYTESNMREVIGAVRRILRDLAVEEMD